VIRLVANTKVYRYILVECVTMSISALVLMSFSNLTSFHSIFSEKSYILHFRVRYGEWVDYSKSRVRFEETEYVLNWFQKLKKGSNLV